jgi:hypothetical protein
MALIHSMQFRRLKYKTQVFFDPEIELNKPGLSFQIQFIKINIEIIRGRVRKGVTTVLDWEIPPRKYAANSWKAIPKH